MDRKVYEDAILVSFTSTPPDTTTDTNTCRQISSPSSNLSKGFDTKLQSSFGF